MQTHGEEFNIQVQLLFQLREEFRVKQLQLGKEKIKERKKKV